MLTKQDSLMLVALGGNAILRQNQPGTFDNQYSAVKQTANKIVKLISSGINIIITHGNGPQVGATMIRHEIAKSIVPAFPLHACGAETQGFLGYIIQQALQNELDRLGLRREAATIITQVIVENNDPAFKNPTKPIGPFYSKAEMEILAALRTDLRFKEEPNKGFRRVVPSPDPKEIVEAETVRRLTANGAIVIASGGGGIPVIRVGTTLQGVDAVIDKDLAAERLASAVHADTLAIMTDVEGVYLNYGSKNQQLLKHVTDMELTAYMSKGHFAIGSMQPKVEAAIRFIQHGGTRAIIGELERLDDAIKGTSATQITHLS